MSKKQNTTEIVYVVRDASGEYLSGKYDGARTPASNEAEEFSDRAAAEAAKTRATDTVYAREI